MKLFILVLIIIFVLNNIWLFVYCRIAEKINRREEAYKRELKKKSHKKADTQPNNTSNTPPTSYIMYLY